MSILRAGDLVDGRYRIERPLSEGGMGAVYVAEHTFLRKQVALKVLHATAAADHEARARFEREARAASRIEHANVVRVTDFGVTDGAPYLVMELVAGHSLAVELERLGRLPTERARRIAADVLRGLEAAHARGVLHRDLKPENVIIAGESIKLVDFGIAQLRTDSDGRMTSTGTVMGTPLYMAPEQVRGQGDLDERVDVYAVGVMLYEMLAGRPPHQGATFGAIAHEILSGRAPALATVAPHVGAALDALVMKALAADRAARFASARELREAIERVTDAPPPPALEAYQAARASRLTDLPRAQQSSLPPPPSEAPMPTAPLLPEAFAPRDEPALELDRPPPVAPPPAPARGLRGRLAVPSLLLAVLLGLGAIAWRRLATPALPPAPADDRPYQLINLPAHARVFLDDAPVNARFTIPPAAPNTTPNTTTDTMHRLRIEARGYATRVMLLGSDSDHVIDGRLDPVR
jgi:serine/threonine-protein kinase